jgi:hypothetical protein
MFWAHEASLDAEQCLLLVLNEGSYFFLRNPEDSQNPLVLLVDKSSIFFPTYGDLTKHQHQVRSCPLAYFCFAHQFSF